MSHKAKRRAAKVKRITKDKQIGVRVSDDELSKIEERARARGMNAAEHLRDLSRRDLEQAEHNGRSAAQ